MDNAAGVDDLAVVPFDSGTRASSLGHDNMALNLYELVPNADDEGPWTVASFKRSW